MNLPIDRSTPLGLGLAFLFGFVFGFLLDRGRVDRYEVIVNFFRLRDFRVIKIMLTAIVVGGIGVFALVSGDLASFHIKTLSLGGVGLGGLLFGVGMVVLGYCPGTGVAALGTGSIHAWIGLAGMLAGSIIYGTTYPWWAEHVLPMGDYGKATLASLTGIGPVVILAVLTVAFLIVALLMRGQRRVMGD